MKAPDFKLIDQDGKFHSLADYRGKWLIVYFYPKDDTPGCTKEACSFRDTIEEYKKRGLNILGISKDNHVSHQKFASKFSLNFPILSDDTHEVINAYGAWGKKKFMGREFEGTLRQTYLINPEGQIVREYRDVDPSVHADQILKDFETLKASA